MMEKLLSTEYEYNPSNRSGTSEARAHTHMQTAYEKQPFQNLGGGDENVSVPQNTDIDFWPKLE
jgi:hypothetical protein